MTKRKPLDIADSKYRTADIRKVGLGCRPFMGGIPYYQARKEAYLTDTTIEENVRKLYYFADIFKQLKAEGTIKNTDPRHIGESDIEGFMIFMKKNKLQSSTKKKYLSMLDSYLGFFGNHIISDMRKQNKFSAINKGDVHKIKYIEEEDLRRIFKYVDNYPGYKGILIRGYFALIFGIAGRPKEIISALISDLDLENEQFYIRHPKGEDSWGVREWISITRKDMMPKISRFLEEREDYLEDIKCQSEFLFVNIETGQPYSLKTIRKIKDSIEKELNIDFKLKEFRSTYATITYKHNKNMKDAISKQLRHYKPSTTEGYYIAYDREQAAKELSDEWKKSKIE